MARFNKSSPGVAKALAAMALSTLIAACATAPHSEAGPTADVDHSQPADPHAAEAAPSTDPAASIKKKVDDLVQQAQDLRSQEKYEEALTRLNQALTMDPGNPGVQAIKDVVEDQIIIQKAQSVPPPPAPKQSPATQPGDQGHAAGGPATRQALSPEVKRQVDDMIRRAMKLRREQRYEGSLALLNQALALDSDNIAAQTMKVMVEDQIIIQNTQRSQRLNHAIIIEPVGDAAAQPADMNGPGDAQADYRTAAKLKEPIPVGFKANDLSRIIDYLHNITGVKIFVNWEALAKIGVEPNTPITLKLNDLPAGQALKIILQEASDTEPAGYIIHDGLIKISSAADLKTATTRPAKTSATKPGADAATQPAAAWDKQSQEIAEREEAKRISQANQSTAARLKDPIPVDFKANKLGHVIDYLRNITGVNIYVNWRALKALGVDEDSQVTLQLNNIPAGQALKLILQGVSPVDGTKRITYTLDEGLVVISTEEIVKPPATAPADAGGR